MKINLILALILNIVAAVIWAILGSLYLMYMYVFVALIITYFLIKEKNK